MNLTQLHAIKAEGIVREELRVEEGEAVLDLDEIGYGFFGNIVMHSDEYYRKE